VVNDRLEVLFEEKLIKGLIEIDENLKLDEYAFIKDKKPAYDAIIGYLKGLVKQAFTTDDG